MKLLALLLLLNLAFTTFLPRALAATDKPNCIDQDWDLKGKIEKDVERYNRFIKRVDTMDNPTYEWNAYLKKYGLPIHVGSADPKGYPDHLVSKHKHLGRKSSVVFLKSLPTTKTNPLGLDTVFEAADENAKTSTTKWPFPMGETPTAIRDREIHFQSELPAICGGSSELVDLAVQPNGTLKVIKYSKADEPEVLPKCKAAKALFTRSDRRTCRGFVDQKTKKKRILVWQTPML